MKWGIKTHPFLISALVFSFLSGALFFVVPSHEARLEIDSHGYDRTGLHFANTFQLIDPVLAQFPISMAGYALVLGMLYKAVGHSYAAVVMLQLLLALLCGWLLFRIARQLFNERIATYTVVLWSINLGFLVYVQFVLTEIVLVTFLLGFLERFFEFWKTKRVGTAALAGLLLGCSILIKPSALFFIIPLNCFIPFLHATWRKRVLAAVVMSICFSLPMLVYVVRNKITFGRFVLFAPMRNEILYRYLASRVKAELEGKDYDQLKQETWFTGTNFLDDAGWDPGRNYLKMALIHHPFVVLRIELMNMLKTGVGLFSTQLKVLLNPAIKGDVCSFFKMRGSVIERVNDYITCGALWWWVRGIAYGEALWTVVRILLMMMALFFLWQQQRFFILSFFITYLGYFIAVTGHDGCCRYRMHVEPLLIILTAVGMYALSEWMPRTWIKKKRA